MHVTTRSKSRLLSTAQAIGPQLSLEPSKVVQQPFETTKTAAFKKSYQSEEARSSTPRTQHESYIPQDLDDQNSHEDPNRRKSSQTITEPPSPNSLVDNIIKTHWSCQQCSCHEGIFKGLIDKCVQCGHTMDDHEPELRNRWNPLCAYMCERQELVASVLQYARQYGVIVLRATPQVGKTTLLRILGHHIVHKVPDLEPVFVHWQDKEKRKNCPYEDFLRQKEGQWKTINAETRPRNPAARPIYLIDEAQGSYEEEEFWTTLKNYHNTRKNALYVLVCVYGATGVSRIRHPNIESQAQRMHALQRIELRPTLPGNPCMLFQREEVAYMVMKFAYQAHLKLENGVIEYLYKATDGHPGMVGLLISHLEDFCKKPGINMPETLTSEIFHMLIVQHEDSFVEWLSRWGRGVWSPWSEGYTRDCLLRDPDYSHLRLLDIKKALRKVAMTPHGLSRVQKDFDAFAYCHKMGYLHTESSVLGNGETVFSFASPLHRRVAYRRLFPGPEPDAVIKDLSLLQICSNAIARFSPGTLPNRRCRMPNASWGIPEAAFQDELYCCLNLELRYLPILSEYSHNKDGRIDFHVLDKKWGIEILQCGSNAEIAEHIARLTPGGRYQRWGIIDDYIILNFCPRSALREAKIENTSIQARFFHVVIEPDELTAEIYTYDTQLYKSWPLGEGRKRDNSYDFNYSKDPDSDADNHCLEIEVVEKERALVEKERALVEKERALLEKERVLVEKERALLEKDEMRLQMEEREKEMRLQMQREKEEMRLKIERDMDRERTAQEQDKLVAERGIKRKR